MSDFAAQRHNMVEGQVRPNDVTDRRVQHAMATIPRERFVPNHLNVVAYTDNCLEVARGRYLLDPRCFAKLAQLASIGAQDRVLDVGCGSGYSSAVLAQLAREVIALEVDAGLVRIASECLSGISNIEVVQGPLSEGLPDRAPFDVIFLNGTVESRPERLLSQLADGGRLVAVIRENGRGQAHLMLKVGDAMSDRVAFDAQVPILPGFEKTPGFVF